MLSANGEDDDEPVDSGVPNLRQTCMEVPMLSLGLFLWTVRPYESHTSKLDRYGLNMFEQRLAATWPQFSHPSHESKA